MSHTIIVYHAKYRGMFQNIVICGPHFATEVAKRVAKITRISENFATFATHFVSAHVTAAAILSTAPLYIMIKY